MAWTNPRTWVAGEVVTAALLNTHLRDNLLALYATHTAVATPQIVNLPTGADSVHRYFRSGNLIVGEFQFNVTGAATGTLDLTLPVTALGPVGGKSIGVAFLNDTGTGSHSANLLLVSTTAARFLTFGSPAAAVNATTPFTWASGDTVGGTYSYEAA